MELPNLRLRTRAVRTSATFARSQQCASKDRRCSFLDGSMAKCSDNRPTARIVPRVPSRAGNAAAKEQSAAGVVKNDMAGSEGARFFGPDRVVIAANANTGKLRGRGPKRRVI